MQKRSNMPTWEWKLLLCWHVFLSINSLGSEHKLYCHLNIVLAAIGGLRAEEICVCAYIYLPCKARGDGCSQQTLPTCHCVCCHAEPTFLRVLWEQGQGEWGARYCMSTSALLCSRSGVSSCQCASSSDDVHLPLTLRWKRKWFLSLVQHGKRNI